MIPWLTLNLPFLTKLATKMSRSEICACLSWSGAQFLFIFEEGKALMVRWRSSSFCSWGGCICTLEGLPRLVMIRWINREGDLLNTADIRTLSGSTKMQRELMVGGKLGFSRFVLILQRNLPSHPLKQMFSSAYETHSILKMFNHWILCKFVLYSLLGTFRLSTVEKLKVYIYI